MIKHDRWIGAYNEGEWSGKKRESRWFPDHSEDFLIARIVDSTSNESTSIYLQYDDKTNKIYRIKNIGRLSNKKILVKIKNRKSNCSWTRGYVISPNKDGINKSNIDVNLTVSNFPLVMDEGKIRIDDETTISIVVEDI